MSKATSEKDTPTTVRSGTSAAAAPATGTAETGATQRAQIQVDDSQAVTCYANFCRVTGTPEELILDFGLNPNAMQAQVSAPPVEVKQRLVLNYFTAKRMLQALHMSVQRHEQAFGVLETDVAKRVVGRGSARAGSA
jgi:Protein of unknown function (DUF3467)